MTNQTFSLADLTVEPLTSEFRGRARRAHLAGVLSIVPFSVALGAVGLAGQSSSTAFQGLAAIVAVAGAALGVMLLIRERRTLSTTRGASKGIALPIVMERFKRVSACPRCHATKRDASGWCGSCTKWIASARTLPPDHPVLAMIAAINRGDTDQAATFLASDCAQHHWSGRTNTGSERLRKQLKSFGQLFKPYSVLPEIAVVDPEAGDIVWTRSVTGGPTRLGPAETWDQQVTRWRLSGGRIAETWVSAPLPTAIGRRAADRA